MEHKYEPISNSIFETYSIQERVKEQKKAIKLLVTQGYTIRDLEGNLMAKSFTKFNDEGNLLESGYTKRI